MNKTMLTMVELIKTTELKIISESTKITNIERSLNKIKTTHMNEISNATDENGKKLYSNETARVSALELVLESNKEYNNYQDLIRDLPLQVAMLNVDLKYYKNLLEIAKLYPNEEITFNLKDEKEPKVDAANTSNEYKGWTVKQQKKKNKIDDIDIDDLI